MEMDMIVVIGLAVLFFCGIIYLVSKEKNKPKTDVEVAPVETQEHKEKPAKERSAKERPTKKKRRK